MIDKADENFEPVWHDLVDAPRGPASAAVTPLPGPGPAGASTTLGLPGSAVLSHPETQEDLIPDHPVTDRDARYLEAARRGALSVVTEYGAVLYLVDRSGTLPSYLAPPPPELFTAGQLAYGDDGVHLEITASGLLALKAHADRLLTDAALETTLTRNPLRGELHNPTEPGRILRSSATGAEIRPGDTVTDPAGHPATYVGPLMYSSDGGVTWMPGSTARVRYDAHGGYLYPPSAIGAAYDEEISRPHEPARLTGVRP